MNTRISSISPNYIRGLAIRSRVNLIIKWAARFDLPVRDTCGNQDTTRGIVICVY
ncbi:MAG: hypothetical protein OEW48_04030 [Phycisphaerae bacterium]|nr:hypothetical protein [Phycisphaerae bacterium]